MKTRRVYFLSEEYFFLGNREALEKKFLESREGKELEAVGERGVGTQRCDGAWVGQRSGELQKIFILL